MKGSNSSCLLDFKVTFEQEINENKGTEIKSNAGEHLMQLFGSDLVNLSCKKVFGFYSYTLNNIIDFLTYKQ